jgi:hypothetical protein
MVESFCRQGFTYLRGGRRTGKRGFRNRTAALCKLGQKRPWRSGPFYRQPCLASGVGDASAPPQSITDRSHRSQLPCESACATYTPRQQSGAARAAGPEAQCAAGPVAKGPSGQIPVAIKRARRSALIATSEPAIALAAPRYLSS